MARIVRFHKLGGPEVLQIEDLPWSTPAQGEVSLRVQAIGLNRAELMFMHGYYLEPAQLPASLGYEASGIVTAIGPDVRSELAEQKCIDSAGFLHESVWRTRRRGDRPGSCFGGVSLTPNDGRGDLHLDAVHDGLRSIG